MDIIVVCVVSAVLGWWWEHINWSTTVCVGWMF